MTTDHSTATPRAIAHHPDTLGLVTPRRRAADDLESIASGIHAICVALITDGSDPDADNLSESTKNNLLAAIQHLTDRQRDLVSEVSK